MKLQTKILLLVIPIVVLPLVWFGVVAYSKLKESSREAILSQMTTLVEQVSLSISTHQTTTLANVELFAGSNLLEKYILTNDEAERYSLMQPPLIRLFASYQQAYRDYYELRILLPDGYEDTRSTLTRLPNKTENEEQSEFFQLLRQDKEIVKALYTKNPDDGKPVLYVGKKLIMRDESIEPLSVPPTLRGYLVVTVDLNFLQEQLNRQRIGDSGFLFITDDSGQPFLIPEHIAIRSFSKQQYTRLQKSINDKNIIKIDFNGQPTYVKGHALRSGLKLFAILPESDLLAASRSLGALMAGITLLTILIASLLIFYVINHILITPIKKLGQVAYDLGHGQFDTQSGITSRDEIGELARSFEEMSLNLRDSKGQVTYLAYHDALTGLPNRRMFQEYLQRAMAHARRRQKNLALLFLDLDNFKRVNDTMGHQYGDLLLQDLAKRLTECMREDERITSNHSRTPGELPQDIVARVGGDEFLILLPQLKNPSGAAIVAQRILAMLAEPFNIKEHEFFVSGSIGISFYPTDGQNVDTLIKNSDIAMYHAKEHGRNNYQYFNESMNKAAVERLAMENALRKAIDNQEFLLYYQPKVDMRSGEINGVEALIRWQHSDMGMLLPTKFIRVAEDTGLIVKIGEWVIDNATRQLAKWHKQGLELSVSINISTLQLNKQNVTEIISHYIDKNRCRADWLEIELTETSIMHAHEKATNMLNDIKSLGVQISMDDFGVGYSSFSYLRNLPIDILKIDRSFIRDITTDQNDAAIISAILAMARTLNLVVVAEGVETIEQLEFLYKNQCDIVQGYLVSRPLPVSELEQFIANRKSNQVVDNDSSSEKIFYFSDASRSLKK